MSKPVNWCPNFLPTTTFTNFMLGFCLNLHINDKEIKKATYVQRRPLTDPTNG